MIKYLNSFLIALFISIFLTLNDQNAAEVLIYGDNISYDKDENIIAKGRAKILNQNKIIYSDLIIY